MRAVMNGALTVLETGCQWRALPKDLPPKSTVHDYLMVWDWDGTHMLINWALATLTGKQIGKCSDIMGQEEVWALKPA